MNGKTLGGLIVLVGSSVFGLALLVGCEGPSHGRRPITSAPAVEQQTDTDTTTEQPEQKDNTSQPEESSIRTTPPRESSTPPPTQPELPDYVHILERFHASEPIQLQAEIAAPHRLVIETRNVRRIRIDRHKLPMSRHRSIILRLDGQGIEWTPKSTTTIFERSINGVWMPVKD